MKSVERLEQIVTLGIEVKEYKKDCSELFRLPFIASYEDGGREYIDSERIAKSNEEDSICRILAQERVFNARHRLIYLSVEEHILHLPESVAYFFPLPDRKYLKWAVPESKEFGDYKKMLISSFTSDTRLSSALNCAQIKNVEEILSIIKGKGINYFKNIKNYGAYCQNQLLISLKNIGFSPEGL